MSDVCERVKGDETADQTNVIPNNNTSPRLFTSPAANNYYHAMTTGHLSGKSGKDKNKFVLGKVLRKGTGTNAEWNKEGDKVNMETIQEKEESCETSDVVDIENEKNSKQTTGEESTSEGKAAGDATNKDVHSSSQINSFKQRLSNALPILKSRSSGWIEKDESNGADGTTESFKKEECEPGIDGCALDQDKGLKRLRSKSIPIAKTRSSSSRSSTYKALGDDETSDNDEDSANILKDLEQLALSKSKSDDSVSTAQSKKSSKSKIQDGKQTKDNKVKDKGDVRPNPDALITAPSQDLSEISAKTNRSNASGTSKRSKRGFFSRKSGATGNKAASSSDENSVHSSKSRRSSEPRSKDDFVESKAVGMSPSSSNANELAEPSSSSTKGASDPHTPGDDVIAESGAYSPTASDEGPTKPSLEVHDASKAIVCIDNNSPEATDAFPKSKLERVRSEDSSAQSVGAKVTTRWKGGFKQLMTKALPTSKGKSSGENEVVEDEGNSNSKANEDDEESYCGGRVTICCDDINGDAEIELSLPDSVPINNPSKEHLPINSSVPSGGRESRESRSDDEGDIPDGLGKSAASAVDNTAENDTSDPGCDNLQGGEKKEEVPYKSLEHLLMEALAVSQDPEEIARHLRDGGWYNFVDKLMPTEKDHENEKGEAAGKSKKDVDAAAKDAVSIATPADMIPPVTSFEKPEGIVLAPSFASSVTQFSCNYKPGGVQTAPSRECSVDTDVLPLEAKGDKDVGDNGKEESSDDSPPPIRVDRTFSIITEVLAKQGVQDIPPPHQNSDVEKPSPQKSTLSKLKEKLKRSPSSLQPVAVVEEERDVTEEVEKGKISDDSTAATSNHSSEREVAGKGDIVAGEANGTDGPDASTVTMSNPSAEGKSFEEGTKKACGNSEDVTPIPQEEEVPREEQQKKSALTKFKQKFKRSSTGKVEEKPKVDSSDLVEDAKLAAELKQSVFAANKPEDAEAQHIKSVSFDSSAGNSKTVSNSSKDSWYCPSSSSEEWSATPSGTSAQVVTATPSGTNAQVSIKVVEPLSDLVGVPEQDTLACGIDPIVIAQEVVSDLKEAVAGMENEIWSSVEAVLYAFPSATPSSGTSSTNEGVELVQEEAVVPPPAVPSIPCDGQKRSSPPKDKKRISSDDCSVISWGEMKKKPIPEESPSRWVFGVK